ncbi:MAG: DNA polymerase, partial [Verrucomicrobiota bacterium]|nr:DNA polymerase [Verrucomicrobiota bacterium]
LQVHDELIFDMEPSEETILRKIITDGMKGALAVLECPIEVDIGVGGNWLEAH